MSFRVRASNQVLKPEEEPKPTYFTDYEDDDKKGVVETPHTSVTTGNTKGNAIRQTITAQEDYM